MEELLAPAGLHLRQYRGVDEAFHHQEPVQPQALLAEEILVAFRDGLPGQLPDLVLPGRLGQRFMVQVKKVDRFSYYYANMGCLARYLSATKKFGLA